MPDKSPIPTMDGYIESFPAATQALLEQARTAIRKAVPEAAETISYGIPTFTLGGKLLVSFAGWKRHIAMYPTPAGDAAFQRKIAPYKHAKSALHFPLDQPLPGDLITEVATFLKAERQA